MGPRAASEGSGAELNKRSRPFAQVPASVRAMPKPPTISHRVELLVRDELGELLREAGFRKTRLVFERVRGAVVQTIQLHAKTPVRGESPPEGWIQVRLGFEAAKPGAFASIGCQLPKLVPEAPGAWRVPPTRGHKRVAFGAELRRAFEMLVATLDRIEDETQLRRALAGGPSVGAPASAPDAEPDGAALLAEIWERPDDRHVLGVYADYLASTGEGTRAEYIQLSLLAARTSAQDKRRTALAKQHRGAWLGAARPFVYTWKLSEQTAGFVALAECAMPKLVAGFELVRALGPRLVVQPNAPKAKREVAALAKLPLGTLYGLALHDNDAQWVTSETLATLGPSLRGLRSLSIWISANQHPSHAGWHELVAQLDALEHLALEVDDPAHWLPGLPDSKIARTLHTLVIPGYTDASLRGSLAAALPACTIRSNTY